MVNLCRLLAARDDGITATVVVTEEWLGLVGAPAASAALGPRVRFEAIPNVVPSEHGRAGDMVGFVEAVYTRKMEGPFERLLDQLAAAPLLEPAAIVADMLVPWTVAVGARRGVPVCVLCPLSATMFAVQYNFHRLPPTADDGGSTSPFAGEHDRRCVRVLAPQTFFAHVLTLLFLGLSAFLRNDLVFLFCESTTLCFLCRWH